MTGSSALGCDEFVVFDDNYCGTRKDVWHLTVYGIWFVQCMAEVDDREREFVLWGNAKTEGE